MDLNRRRGNYIAENLAVICNRVIGASQLIPLF